jgi:hypothetical protein
MSTIIKHEVTSNPFEDPTNQLPSDTKTTIHPPQKEYVDAFPEFNDLYGRTVYTGKRLSSLYSDDDASSTEHRRCKLRKTRHAPVYPSRSIGQVLKQQLYKSRQRSLRKEAERKMKKMGPVYGRAEKVSYAKICGRLGVVAAVKVASTVKKCCSLKWFADAHYKHEKVKAMPSKKGEDGGRRGVVKTAVHDRTSGSRHSRA